MPKIIVTGGAGFIPQPVNYGPAKVGETCHIYLDATKAGRDLGWAPTLSLEAGLERIVDYFREKEQAP